MVSRPSLPGCMRRILVVEFQELSVGRCPLTLSRTDSRKYSKLKYEFIWALKSTKTGLNRIWSSAMSQHKVVQKLLDGLGSIWALCRSCCMAVCLCFWPMPFIRGVLKNADGRHARVLKLHGWWHSTLVCRWCTLLRKCNRIVYNMVKPHQVWDISVPYCSNLIYTM